MNGFSAWMKDKLRNLAADLKRFHRSWTILFGIVAEFLVEYMPEITQAVTEMESYVLPETYKRAMQGIIFVNMLLRFKTTTAMRNK